MGHKGVPEKLPQSGDFGPCFRGGGSESQDWESLTTCSSKWLSADQVVPSELQHLDSGIVPLRVTVVRTGETLSSCGFPVPGCRELSVTVLFFQSDQRWGWQQEFRDHCVGRRRKPITLQWAETEREHHGVTSCAQSGGSAEEADAVNNAAGFGFSGMDKDGRCCWDLLSNLNIWKIETATSFKMYLENWNIQTAAWLKCVCYERVPWCPTVLTFILSALWHGVYPGYYFTFLTGVLVTLAARAVRNNCRHHFLSSKALKCVYDLVTWAVTQLAVSYTVAPFVMLAAEPALSLYTSMYFYLHIISLLVILFLPIKPQAHLQRQPQTANSVNKKKTD
ncbi:Hypothetical predicted protein [Marmota monax]|uniref:Uncharacterized protein n=1 Tax=Marmota monax TaxID=9995 RepID=A0A5E4C4I9_MARMO|nr:hypothetical protein GHT09_010305 [Marmota monax]VTJ76029.1 Hypothetical predicted protein [Marmota monax]